VSYGAIRHFGQYLQSGHRCSEFGSGGSSLFVAGGPESLLTVDMTRWRKFCSKRRSARGLANLHSEFHPLETTIRPAFARAPFASRVRSADWDAGDHRFALRLFGCRAGKAPASSL